MRRRNTTDQMVTTTLRIARELWRATRMHVLTRDGTAQSWVIEAIREKLAREGAEVPE